MRGTCVSFWLHGPRSISRGCVPDTIEEIAPLLLYPLRMLGTGHCCVRYGFTAVPERSPCRPRDGLGVPASPSPTWFNLHRLDLPLHRPSIPSSLFVPQVSLLPHLKTGYRQSPDCALSPSRAVKTTGYATPREPSPRSRPQIAGHVDHCF